MKIVDLREVHPRALEGLFDEQARFWRDVFLWDYRPALDMIRRFVSMRSLEGFAIMEGDQAVAYSFYVLEDGKGLIGDFFVSQRFSAHEAACPLLTRILASLQMLPWISRIETHIMPLEAEMLHFLTQRGFSLYERQFMHLNLARETAGEIAGVNDGGNRGATDGKNAAPRDEPGLGRILESGASVAERWNDRNAAAVARLIQLAYATHVDSQINDQYSSELGARHFLRNITQTLACGEFLPDASLVFWPPGESQPVGVILASKVADGVAHITQICVMPGYQRNGIGRILMDKSAAALRARHYHGLTLTVTSANRAAVGLYESLGFQTLRKFCAGVWQSRSAKLF
jgi:ribosomal protein S18 acetylase RimI-like enzyme